MCLVISGQVLRGRDHSQYPSRGEGVIPSRSLLLPPPHAPSKTHGHLRGPAQGLHSLPDVVTALPARPRFQVSSLSRLRKPSQPRVLPCVLLGIQSPQPGLPLSWQLQVPFCTALMQTLLILPALPPCSPGVQSSSKPGLQAWRGASSPDKGQCHSKMSPAPGGGEDNHTHGSQLAAVVGGGGADIWSEGRPCSPTNFSGSNKHKAGATESLANPCSDSTQTPGGPRLAHKQPRDKTLPTTGKDTLCGRLDLRQRELSHHRRVHITYRTCP